MTDEHVVIHGLKTCDACRKALKWCRENGVRAELRDIRASPLSDDERARFLGVLGDDLFNRRSTTWRALNETERAADPDALLAAHPALMKRPVIEAGGTLRLGWTDAARAALSGT